MSTTTPPSPSHPSWYNPPPQWFNTQPPPPPNRYNPTPRWFNKPSHLICPLQTLSGLNSPHRFNPPPPHLVNPLSTGLNPHWINRSDHHPHPHRTPWTHHFSNPHNFSKPLIVFVPQPQYPTKCFNVPSIPHLPPLQKTLSQFICDASKIT